MCHLPLKNVVKHDQTKKKKSMNVEVWLCYSGCNFFDSSLGVIKGTDMCESKEAIAATATAV